MYAQLGVKNQPLNFTQYQLYADYSKEFIKHVLKNMLLN